MKKILFSCAVVMTLLSCGNNKKEDAAGTGSGSASIAIDGSSTVYPITEAVAEEFRAEHPDVDVTIGVSGTGGGFKKFGRGEIDIADASRPIKDEERITAQSNKIDYVGLEVAYDGLAVVVHPENDWLTCITTEELKKIWEPAAQGTIKKWNQINPAWPDEEIHLFGPGVASGTFDYFTEAIVGKSGSSRGDYTASEDDNVLVQGIAGDKYGLGFFGVAYYQENKDKLKLVGVDGGKGCIMPSIETISNGTYSPLARPVYIYVSSAAIKKPEVVEFVQYYLNEVSSLLKDVGYVPLTNEEYAAEHKKLEEFINKNK
jgi:phosphate transport system substrate-binding protein